MTQKNKSEIIEINRLRIVLAELNISQKDLAQKLQVSPITISRICKNIHQPSVKFFREIALALDIDIRELFVPTKPKKDF